MAVQHRPIDRPEPGRQTVAQRGDPGGVAGHALHRDAGGLAETGDPRDVLGAAATAALLAAAVEERLDTHTGADVQRPDALGTVALVRRHGQQIDVQVVHVERYDTHALRRVGVKTHTAFAGDPANLGDRRQRPDLVVA